jgi:hypothetical protein
VGSSQSGSQFKWKEDLISVKRSDRIVFFRKKSHSLTTEISIDAAGKSYHLPDSDIQFSIELVSRDRIEYSHDATVEYISGENLQFPLKIRRWKARDRFKPLGFKNFKLVSDFLTDRKIGVPEKKDIFLLMDRSEIVAVIGYQISDDYRVTEETKTIYRLILRKETK